MAPTDFASLKKNRSKSLDKLNQQLEKITTKSYSDPNEGKFWKPTRDKAGNGFAVIRFLPAPGGEEMPFVRIWDHGFQGPTGLWYIENSLTTINQDDPVSEFNSKLWNSGVESDKDQARKQKRRLKYYSNIYVVKDSANPENEGKVFMYAFGKKIFDKLNDLMNPTFEDEDPVNPFDLWEGANFRLKIRNVEGYRNYDKSEFDSPSELAPQLDDSSDEYLEELWGQCASLADLVDPKNFKSYEELQARLNKVLGASAAPAPKPAPAPAPVANDNDVPFDVEPAPKASTTDDDDDLSFFKSLADE